MRLLEIRQADFSEVKYITSEIEIIKALNKKIDAYLWGIGKTSETNKLTKITLFKAPFNKASLFQLKVLFLLPFTVLYKRIDVIMFDYMSVFSSMFLIFLSKFKNISLYLDIRTIPVENASNYKIARFIKSCKFASKYFSGATFITNGTKKYIEENYGIFFKKNSVWTSGVNLEIFNSANINPIAIPGITKLIQDKFIIFYHGSISENRGINLVLDSLNRLRTKIPELLLVSLSMNNNFIIKYCKDNNLDISDNLLLIDSVPNTEVPNYIAFSDLGVIPLPRIDWWEVSSPLKLMEYLAMETPVVLSDIKAHKEVVPIDSEFAVYFNPDNNESLDQAILNAYFKRDLLAKNAYKARLLVENNFTWEKQADKLLKLFSEHQ
jgi:glycosyltransferase involved in cell wall biosynthesis